MKRFQLVFKRLSSHYRGHRHRVHYGYSSLALALGTIGGYYASNWERSYTAKSVTRLSDMDELSYAKWEDRKLAYHKIKSLLREDQWSTDKTELEHCSSNDYSTHQSDKLPQLVVFPESTEQVSDILKICHSYKVPVVPVSGATSIEGNFNTTRNGLVISLSLMDKIIQLNEQDMDCTLQPGVGWQDLNEYLKPRGLLFGPDPGPGAQIGGMCGTSCSGTNAAKYGTMKDNVISLTVVLPDGTVVKTRKRPRKSSAGYNLTGLFVGSEGTLGIVTEITVKLHHLPRFETVGVVSFARLIDATNMVTRLIQHGVSFNAVELLDENMIDVINKSGQCNRSWPVNHTLFMKIGGSSQAQLQHQLELLQGIGRENNALAFSCAKDSSEAEELWQARKVGFWSTIQHGKSLLGENAKVWTTDVAVPISKLSCVIEETMEDINSKGIFTTILGHVGDGNFHCILVYKPEDQGVVSGISERVVQRALDNEGTCTGEHGIGLGKRKYLQLELGEDTVALMRQIKLSVDPHGIMNPDKVFSTDPEDN
ncbi:DLD4 [Cyberlindnera jadinii]|uniref:D-lactate dehydrogenase (cytochrome) n=1 Tax=Cyberlindnera jadinii (strain ATCC 18201 / CBS 1600 / BCRC 20928 / JCM 3617 / NBRC 0987 / NRRL Y-1542) TaxID=983966 RepID=A0A0H5C2B6_CYBJN|nr:DLD4 [Cyberlindnera jadinii]